MNRSGRIVVVCSIFVLLAFDHSAAKSSVALPRVFSSDAEAIVRARQAYRAESSPLKPALEQLKKDADAAMDVPLHSVMEKSQTPPGGDKHDYMSLARYYWPDSTKPNGLPYVSRDGHVNPEILTITDATYFATMVETAHTLALASFIFGEERYAERAARILRVWFLDSATAMNPHLEHAQFVKGMDDGRPAGTIETRDIGMVCDAAGLLSGSRSWSAADRDGLHHWFSAYLHWLTTSKRAIAASNFENNIAIWFAVQAGSVALFVDDTAAARQIFEKARALAVDRQIQPNGEQPHELTRATSANYVLFNIEAFFRLAELSAHAGIDLWAYRSVDGRSLRGSLDWVLPYLRKEKTWTWNQIKPFDWNESYYVLLEQASGKFHDPEYARLAGRLAKAERQADRVHLLYSAPDLLKTTIERAYAVGRLFHRVINPEWEGASGAIGDALLYRATHDQTLANLYLKTFPLVNMHNGTWVDDRAWVCLAELTWWNATGRTHREWVEDAKHRYLEARQEGRLSHHEGFWSWYNFAPSAARSGMRIFTNTNMNQMATVACMLYEATHEKQFLKDAMLVWDGDATTPGIGKLCYRGNGVWKGKQGEAAFGQQFPWEGAGMCTIGAALYRVTGREKYREAAVATAKRIMDPANGWVDPTDFYQLKMDGNGAFVMFILDAYRIAPKELADVPQKVALMLDHVWSNHHGTATVTLHRAADDGIRNGWNPNGGEDGYKVDEVGTVHPQAQAVMAFGALASILKEQQTMAR